MMYKVNFEILFILIDVGFIISEHESVQKQLKTSKENEYDDIDRRKKKNFLSPND